MKGVKIIRQESDLPPKSSRLFLRLWSGVFLVLLGVAGLVVTVVKKEPDLGGVVLRSSDGLPLLGLAHVSPAAVDVLCVIDISQLVARVNIQGLLVSVANDVCDFATYRKQGIRITKVVRERCASFILLNIINADLLPRTAIESAFSLPVKLKDSTKMFSWCL